MRTPTQIALPVLFVISISLGGLVGPGCSSSPSAKPDGGGGKDGAAGTGAAGTGSAGTGTAGTGSAGTGAAGTGAAGTGAAGTGAAGTGTDGAAGTGAAGTSDGAAGTGSADGGMDKASTDVAADTTSTDVAADTSVTETNAETSSSDAAIACVTIGLPAPVFAHYLTAAGPAPAGGDIVDGTYSLTELNHYGSATAMTSNDPIRSAIKFAGNAIEWANQAKEEPATGGSFTYVKATNALTLTKVCPTPGAGGGPGYTATATTFKLYLDAEYVYTKQ